MKKKKPEDTDYVIARLIAEIRDVSKPYPTLMRITAHFNVMVGLLNLCAVHGDEESLVKIANEFHEGLLNHIADSYEKKSPPSK